MRALQALGAALRGSLEDPSSELSAGRLLSQIGSPGELWTGGGTTHDPMRVGAVLRCLGVLSAAVAGCPIQVRTLETKETVRIPVLESRRTGTTPFETWETATVHQAGRGNTYVRKIRANDRRRIVGLLPIHPSRVTVEVVDVDGAGIGVPWAKRFTIDGNKDNPLTEHEIMHVPGLSENGIVGLSPIGQLRRTLNLATKAEQVADKLFEQGMLLSGFLTTDQSLNEEKAEILKARWRAKLAGVDNAYEVAVLDNGAKFHQLTMSPADAQFLETRKYSVTEIARLWGIPGWLVNDQEKSTSWGSGMETMLTAFVMFTLKPYLQRFEQRITREICDPLTEEAQFRVEGLLRGDSKSRAAFYNAGIVGGWLVPNDIRPLEDMKKVPWGDEPYLPHNTAAGDKPGSSTDKTEDDDDDEQ